MIQNYKQVEHFLTQFLADEVGKTGLKNVILGLSGGVDSAVVAVLAQKSFGKNFTSIMMPSSSSSPQSVKDAKELCDKFGIVYQIEPIGVLIDAYFKDKDANRVRMGNFSARMRMATLYDLSHEKSALVIGTSNKSEIALGYGTIFGDLACAINPIGDLYKSEIFEFAKYLGVPESIINKPPSADLWDGQSDEKELGFSYADIDKVLVEFLDNGLTQEEILKQNFNEDLVNMIFKRFYTNRFKTKLPIMANLKNI